MKQFSSKLGRIAPAVAKRVARYDAAYTARKDFTERPNAFLAKCLKRIAPAKQTARKRRALDIGLGQGRNAVLMAKFGFSVTGIDRSPVGLAAAQRLAGRCGVKIDVLLADNERYDFGQNRWDLVALLYYPQPMIIIERLKRAVRKGGYIVVERFTKQKSINPLDARETKRPSPMLRAFVDWRVVHYEHDEFDSDWHWDGESPRGKIVRLLVRKP